MKIVGFVNRRFFKKKKKTVIHLRFTKTTFSLLNYCFRYYGIPGISLVCIPVCKNAVIPSRSPSAISTLEKNLYTLNLVDVIISKNAIFDKYNCYTLAEYAKKITISLLKVGLCLLRFYIFLEKFTGKEWCWNIRTLQIFLWKENIKRNFPCTKGERVFLHEIFNTLNYISNKLTLHT